MSKPYLTHTACDIAKVPKRAFAKGVTVEEAVQQYLVQLKYDGVCGVLIYSPEYTAFLSRTGETIHSCQHVIDALDSLPFDMLARLVEEERYRDEELRTIPNEPQLKYGVYFGELWHPTLGQSNISGAARRHEADDESRQLQFVVHDFVTLEEYEEGTSSVGFEERIERIAWMQAIYHPDDGGEFANNVKPSAPPIWFCGHEGMVCEQAAVTIAGLANEACDSGAYDGIILRDPTGPWVTGARDQYVIKVKPTLRLDLEVIGAVEGKGKYAGSLGALIIQYKDTSFQLSGMSDAQRAEWWEEPQRIIGKIVEVEAMSESSKGKLREPRFKGVRHDSVREEDK